MLAEIRGALLGAGHDEVLDALPEGDIAGGLTQILVEAVDVLLLLAAGRVHIRRATTPGARLAGSHVHLPVARGPDVLGRVGGGRHGRGDEVAEPLRVDHYHPVGLVLVQGEQERGHVGVPPPGRLGQIHRQPVDLEEPVLGREDRQGPRPRMLLSLDELPYPLL